MSIQRISQLERGHPRLWFGRKSLPKLADFSLSWAEGEVKMFRLYREIQNLDQNLPESLNISQNFSLSESSRMAPGQNHFVRNEERRKILIDCVEVLRPSQPNGVM